MNTPHEIANEIMMQRTLYDTETFILLEGPTDAALYAEFISLKQCKLIPANSADKVIKAIHILESRGGDEGLLGIVDADFRVLESEPLTANVILTDASDAEIMTLQSPALIKVFRHTISFQKIKSFNLKDLENLCSELVNLALKLCLPLGYLRWLGYRKPEYNFSYRNFSFSDLIEFEVFEIDEDRLIDVVANHVEPFFDIHTVRDEIEDLKKYSRDAWKICRGHDLLGILSVLIRWFFKHKMNYELSDKEEIQLTKNELSRTLRMSYELSYFQDTELYQKLLTWEHTNSPYKIFD